MGKFWILIGYLVILGITVKCFRYDNKIMVTSSEGTYLLEINTKVLTNKILCLRFAYK